MNPARRLLPLVALVALACSHRGASKEAATQPAPPRATAGAAAATGGTPGDMAAMCPLDVPGTQVTAADTATGAALSFTTSATEGAAELRTRVRRMADMHNARHAEGAAGMHHGHGGGMGAGPGAAHPAPPPATAAV